MNKRFIVLLIAFTLAGFVAQAQINQADKLFTSYSYSLAIPQYLKIAQKAGDPDRNHAITRLADCYRLVNDQLNAKAWYERAVEIPNTESINWFYYGEALRCAEEYELAKTAFETYDSLNPSDPRGKAYAPFCNDIQKLNQIPATFEIKQVPILNSERSDFGPTFYNNGVIYVSDRRQNFMENRKYEWTNFNYLDLFFSTPRYLDQFFQEMNEPKLFTGKFNQIYHDGPASFARHDSLMYLTRTERGKEPKDADNYRTDRLKIFWSKYDGSWSSLEPFTFNSEEYSVGHPVLTPDGNTIYFVSDMPGGLGGTDIYCSKWQNGQWGQPVNLGASVNTFGDEMFPAINGNQLYFATNGIAGFGGLDLFRSKLVDDKWSKAENLGQPINSSFDDFALVLDKHGKQGFFSSNRPGGQGNDDIYACKVVSGKAKKTLSEELLADKSIDSLSAEISGFVRDKQTLKPLPGSTVFLLNTQTGKVRTLKTDANGHFKTQIRKGDFYVLKGMENNYLSDCMNFKFETSDTSKRVTTPRDLLLDHLEVNKIFSVRNMDYAIETIYYDFNKWFIRPDAEKELDKLVQVMKENPIVIELGSHTDCRGSKEYNLDLSQKRAESAVRYIVLQGIEATRITAKGYGESQPVNHCTDGVSCTPAEHQANRRTEFKVTGFTKSGANPEYDMNKFKGDEEIPVYMFDRDFFIDCLEERKITKPETNQDVNQDVNMESAPAVMEEQVVVSTPYSENKKAVNEKAITPDKPIETTPSAKEPANSNTGSVSTNPGTVTYRVQILALSNEKSLLDPEFEVFDDVQMYIEEGLYKYTTGVFSTHEDAINYRSKVVEMGYTDAFVVTFANGKRIYVGPSN
jgi:outer membrane protein OmpA-like peptidoglycan-associated protein/tetratricopeptide (TPR) repeat protein